MSEEEEARAPRRRGPLSRLLGALASLTIGLLVLVVLAIVALIVLIVVLL